MKSKKIVLFISLAVLLVVGCWGVTYNYVNSDVQNVQVTRLGENEYEYAYDQDGVADYIVRDNIEKTMAANNVAAIVFDFRGFDTLGESFILLTAIAGSFVILARAAKKKNEEGEA